ncbi:MAG: thiamine pyrophosphate-binding protein [Proteobacteria bacterium]|nr:thiamine pyrophosphate-binding protein [Pseudomonadota bacterium]
MTTVKRALVQTLLDCGATTAFTLPGLGVTWMLDEFFARKDEFRLVLTRSEQIASVMAQVYGKLTGRPGILMGQGPWISTTGGFGILEAYFCGSPMVVLTETSCYDGFGQYGVYQAMTGDYGAADVRTVLRTMTKFVTYATEPEEAVYGLQLAYKHASLPRQGPAAVVLKTPIIRREIPESPRARLYPTAGYLSSVPARPDPEAVATCAQWLAAARAPIIVAGNGVQNERGRAMLARVAERAGIAVATSYNGKGAIDETSPPSVGMLGTWGCQAANASLAAADFVLVLGASLGPDYTGFRNPQWLRPGDQRIVQVDVDARNAGWVVPVDLAVSADAADMLEALDAHGLGADRRAERLEGISLRNATSGYGVLPATQAVPGTMHYSDVVRALDRFLTRDDMLTLDAGTNRIWVTNALRVRTPGQLVVPGGIGGMGWGLPAAAAAKLVHPGKNVVSLIGDGGMAMTMAALTTCVQQNLPITVVVANNDGLGMVRDNQKGRVVASDFAHVDFARVAEGMGCRGVRVDYRGALLDAMIEARGETRPTVIDVAIDPTASHVPASNY